MYTLLRAMGDVGLLPFTWMPDAVGLVALSVSVGLLFLLLFRLVTPRRRIRRAKELMSACIYEMRIFAAHPGQVLRAQGRAIGWTGVYLILALPALLLLFPPTAALLVRGATWYEYRPLQRGEETLLTVSLAREAPVEVTAVGDGVEVVPPLVMVRSEREAHVRLRARRDGLHHLRIRVGDGPPLDKTVRVGPGGPVSLYREAADHRSWRTLLGHEATLPAGPVQRVELSYPQQTLELLGLAWYWVLMILSLVTAFALRRRMGVVF